MLGTLIQRPHAQKEWHAFLSLPCPRNVSVVYYLPVQLFMLRRRRQSHKPVATGEEA